MDVNKEVRYVFLICGTNHVDKKVLADIVKGTKYAIQLVKCKFYNCKVIVLGMLPQDYIPVIRRNKIRLVNIWIKYAAGKMKHNDIIYRPRSYMDNIRFQIRIFSTKIIYIWLKKGMKN